MLGEIAERVLSLDMAKQSQRGYQSSKGMARKDSSSQLVIKPMIWAKGGRTM